MAINPVFWGSGSNLKQVEYLAAGLPSVTTPAGARGFALKPSVHAIVESLEEMPRRLAWLLQNQEFGKSIARAGREFAERYFDWTVLGRRLNKVYEAMD